MFSMTDARNADRRPLIAHIVFRFDYGGLENGVVNVVNGLPESEFRHAIVALTEATAFSSRLKRADVSVHALGKRPGKDPAALLRLFRLLRTMKPTLVHTRNLATIEGALVAALAGVPCRIHGEHGWDVHDPEQTIIIELHDERYSELIVEVENPQMAVQQISAFLPRG